MLNIISTTVSFGAERKRMVRKLILAAATGLAIVNSASAAAPHYPQTATLGGQPTAAEAATVRSVLGRSFGQEWVNYEKQGHRVNFTVGHADLNGDGRPDLFVSLSDSGFGYCGSGGCAGYAILATQQGYAAKAVELAYFFQQAVVLPAVHKGMHDLRYDDAHKTFQWNGKEYQ